MKRKILSTICLALFGGYTFSQVIPMEKGYPVDKRELLKLHSRTFNKSIVEREIIDRTFFIHYPILDNLNQGADTTFESFLWRLHKDYNSNDPGRGGNFNLASVIYRNWDGFEDFGYFNDIVNSLDDETEVKPNRYVQVDTVYALFSHENNSGQKNRIITQLSSQAATGGFSEASNTILFRDTIETDTSLSFGKNWLGSGALRLLIVPVNKDVPVGRFPGVRIVFEGPKTDTMGILGSYVPNPGSDEGVPLKSSYPFTTYLRQPGTLSSSIFNPAGVYYPNPDPSSGDTVFYYLQNLQIFIQAKIKEGTVSVGEFPDNNLKMGVIFPNPAVDNATLNIELAKSTNVTVQIFDITGKLISSQPQGYLLSGENRLNINTSMLTSGSYFYNLMVDGLPPVSNKLTIVK